MLKLRDQFVSGLAWVIILTCLASSIMRCFKPEWISQEQAIEFGAAILFCSLAIAIFNLTDRVDNFDIKIAAYIITIFYGFISLIHFLLPEYSRDVFGVKEKFYTALMGLSISLIYLTPLGNEKKIR